MSTHSMKTPASEDQLAYIKRLQMELGEGVSKTEKDMDKTEASMVIGKLVAKAQKNHSISEARLEMAIRECFKKWTRFGTDVWRQHREDFIKEVIDTYMLFSEIAQRLETKKRA
jgi:hypothetical protein